MDVPNGTALEKELNDEYGPNKTKFYKCDVTSQELDDAFDDVIKQYGYIDVVVNNAGIMNDNPRLYAKEIAINLVSDRNINIHNYSITHNYLIHLYHELEAFC